MILTELSKNKIRSQESKGQWSMQSTASLTLFHAKYSLTKTSIIGYQKPSWVTKNPHGLLEPTFTYTYLPLYVPK